MMIHPIMLILLEEMPILGSGKTNFSATKKIALFNDQE